MEECIDMTATFDIKKAKKCAFCKYWYDPANSNISPKNPRMGLWQINDTNKTSTCLKSNLKVPAHSTCFKYECKI